MKKIISHSVEETEVLAAKWLVELAAKASDPEKAMVVGLSGHLGAGKTAFTKAVAKALGVTEGVTSPTFVLMKTYEINHPKWKHLVHIDAYRLEGEDDAKILKLDELRNDPTNLIMVEWVENVGEVENFPNYCHMVFKIPDGAEGKSVREVVME
jgi:tRNA threonylcarbamoyladenosine biosynthesis protein TsaE